jgi:hypothetical protein
MRRQYSREYVEETAPEKGGGDATCLYASLYITIWNGNNGAGITRASRTALLKQLRLVSLCPRYALVNAAEWFFVLPSKFGVAIFAAPGFESDVPLSDCLEIGFRPGHRKRLESGLGPEKRGGLITEFGVGN